MFKGGGFYPKTREHSTIINTNKAFYWSYKFKMILLKERLVKFNKIKRTANLSQQSFEHNCQFYMGTLEKIIVRCYAVNHRVNHYGNFSVCNR